MKKRFLSLTVMAALVLSLCGGTAQAVQPRRASETIHSFALSATQGKNKGEIKINFNVNANRPADEVGISSIVIYKSDSSYVTTITGSKDNGLLVSGTDFHSSSYTYKGISGTTYYAIVTCTATIGSKSDTRTLTTNDVTAP